MCLSSLALLIDLTYISSSSLFFFFFNDTATTEIYTLSLHDALPIFSARTRSTAAGSARASRGKGTRISPRSEEHTSELQSPDHLVCRLLLEKKKNTTRSVMGKTRVVEKNSRTSHDVHT